MLGNIVRKIKISSRMFVICMNNSAIITLNAIKTNVMPITSYFI